MPIIQRIEVRCDLMGFWLFYFMENEVEIWKEVDGYKGRYSVSTFGNIRNNESGRLMKKHLRGGYYRVGLFIDKKQKSFNIHSLMGLNFIDKNYLLKKLVVNHIDFNKNNNLLTNLEVITARENLNQKHRKSSSKYVGVSWCNSRKRWRSNIALKNYSKRLGTFDNEIEAHYAYENALKYINSPDFDISFFNPTKVKTSKYKGVSLCRTRNKWISKIRINGKEKNIGYFKTEEEAYMAIQNFNPLLPRKKVKK